MSVTFAYLTVAYLVGKSMSRFQCVAISALYLMSAAIFGTSAQGYGESWHRLNTRDATILREAIVFSDSGFYPLLIASFFVGGTALSIYFMYDVRKRRAKDTA